MDERNSIYRVNIHAMHMVAVILQSPETKMVIFVVYIYICVCIYFSDDGKFSFLQLLCENHELHFKRNNKSM